MVLFAVLFGDGMGVRRHIVQFGCPAAIVVMGFRIVSRIHNQPNTVHESDHSQRPMDWQYTCS